MATKAQFDLKSLEVKGPIIIGYHGGCPDGCGAAHMMETALKTLKYDSHVVPIGHTASKFADVVKPNATVFSLDISPSVNDIEALRSVHQVVIVDHHASEKEVQDTLTEELSHCVNLSNNDGDQCGCSLVRDLVKGIDSFDGDIVHLLHKMDVFTHKLPEHLEKELQSFKAYLTQNGERNVTVDLVEQMFQDKEECMRKGKVLTDRLVANTDALAATFEVVIDKPGFRVLHAEQSKELRPVDIMYYQSLIDNRIDGKPTLVLTQDRQQLTSGMYNVGLRRAGDKMDVSMVCAKVKPMLPFEAGGGHPYAGGLQTSHFVERDSLLKVIKEGLTELYPVEMKVTTKKSAGFYIKAAKAFLNGTEGKDGRKNLPVHKLVITGLGDAINIAVQVAAVVEKEGLVGYGNIATSYVDVQAGTTTRVCAHIRICVCKK